MRTAQPRCTGPTMSDSLALFHATHKNYIAESGGNLKEPGTKSHSPGRTSGLDTHGGNRGSTEIIRHKRSNVFLTDKETRCHRTNIHGIDMIHTGIFDRFQCRLNKKVAQRLFPQFAEFCHSNSDNCYIAHIRTSYSFMIILPRYLAYCP